jgi:tripartite-type tricarboxylate transporter receptor subunit TctC
MLSARNKPREHPMRFTPALTGALMAAALGALASPAGAQTWPARAITAISPFSAGNAVDITGRVVLDQMSKQLGQPIVIENRPGAGGTTAFNSVARAAPDGYTILLGSSTFSSGVVLHKTLPYDTLRDFAAVIPFGAQPSVLVTAPSKGFKTVADLVAAAKAKPGAMNYASAGIGAASHIAAERFRLATGIVGQHVPFRGPNEALAEVIAGRIDFYFLPLAPALPMVKSGQLVALAVSTAQRAPSMPDVPTTAEAGYPAASYLFWSGLFAPAKTPADVVGRLYDEGRKALDLPNVQEALTKLGVQPMRMTSAEFQKFFADDVAETVKLAKEAGIQPTD